MTTPSIKTAMPQTLPARRHPSTPIPRIGFHFPESAEGSLPDLADRAQNLFTQAITLLETSLPEAEEAFAAACKILPMPSEAALKDASGSDRAIYTAVQKQTEKVKSIIQARLKSFGAS